MVKGNTRRVVVVKSPDEKLFEQAIFLLREDAVERGGISDSELLREAKNACRDKKHLTIHRCQKLLWFAVGAGLCSVVWIAATVLPL